MTNPIITWAVLAGLSLALAACQGGGSMSVTSSTFGAVDGQPVELYTLTNTNGMIVRITNYGAIVTDLYAPDRNGEMADIVLGFDSVEEYVEKSPYFGAMCGRVANRVANARFTLEGEHYELAANNDPHSLHGGTRGFDKVVWEAEPLTFNHGAALRLKYWSPAGEEGYPGNLYTTVTYELTNRNELIVHVKATCDKATPVNIVHHSYWNLAGHDAGDILGHEMKLFAANYTPADATLIPTGEIAPVAGTPYDFTTPKPIGRDLAAVPADPPGYDLNFVIDGRPGTLRPAARVRDPGSGRAMEILTNQAGIQFYTGNFLDGIPGKAGAAYGRHHGFCLETQHFPDTINKEGTPGWPTVVLYPGETYQHTMIHKFLVD